MINKWFKMYGGEYLSDPKMKSLTATERSCWITLLCYASVSSVEGEVMHLTEKQLMLDSGVDPMADEWGKTVGILSKFDLLGMVKMGIAGRIVISHWNDRQEKQSMSGYERIRRHRERSKTKEQIENIQTEQFERFWGAYPRKVKKKIAFEKWCALNPDLDLVEKILAAVAQQSKSPQWKKDEGQFIPHPSTWINERRWEDEVSITTQKVGGGKFEKVKSIKIKP